MRKERKRVRSVSNQSKFSYWLVILLLSVCCCTVSQYSCHASSRILIVQWVDVEIASIKRSRTRAHILWCHTKANVNDFFFLLAFLILFVNVCVCVCVIVSTGLSFDNRICQVYSRNRNYDLKRSNLMYTHIRNGPQIDMSFSFMMRKMVRHEYTYFSLKASWECENNKHTDNINVDAIAWLLLVFSKHNA